MRLHYIFQTRKSRGSESASLRENCRESQPSQNQSRFSSTRAEIYIRTSRSHILHCRLSWKCPEIVASRYANHTYKTHLITPSSLFLSVRRKLLILHAD